MKIIQIIDKFTEHPHQINESYWQHFIFALSICFNLIKIAIGLFIHAIFPFLLINFASSKIEQLSQILIKRKQKRL